MKRIILLICLAAPALASAQSYQIEWYKFSGGGGSSTGGVYSISGTFGQTDAGGAMAGGGYSLTGGFWALYAVPTPGAPRLTIALTSTNTALISWPSPSTSFILQQNSNLGSPNWVIAPQTPTDNGTTVSVIVDPPTGNLWYRLKH